MTPATKTTKTQKAPKETTVKTVGEEKSRSVSGGKEETFSRIRIKIRAYDNRIIDQATKTIVETVNRFDAKVVGPVPLPTEKRKFTVNRSTFVHKDAREQFEMRIHKRLVDILNASPKCVDALMSLSLPAGVDIEVKM